MTPDWQLAAELSDTARASKWNREQRPCIYCGTLTRAISSVCLAHSDLPRVDPHLNVQASRFTKQGVTP